MFYNFFMVDFEIVMVFGVEKFLFFHVENFFLLTFAFFLVFEVFVYFLFFFGLFVEYFRHFVFLRFVVNNLYQLLVFDYCLSYCGQF